MLNLVISLLSGAVGGNFVKMLMGRAGLSYLWSTITGLIGGYGGSTFIDLGGLSSALSSEQLLGSIVTSLLGGSALSGVGGLVKTLLGGNKS